MGFEGLLGNRQLKENLLGSIARGSISHFYLIAGPKGSGKMTLARLLAAAILCQGEQKPCMGCTACRKVMADTHPDLITVRDPEHKTVPVRVIRQVREEMFIRPNEADKKIYLLPQEMGIEGQNALLKILEEPPKHGVFMLLTDNEESLLPTVRSRCTLLRLQSLEEDVLRAALTKEFPGASKESVDGAIWRSGGFLGQAKEILAEGAAYTQQTKAFVESFGKKDPLGLLHLLMSMERWKRDDLCDVLNQWIQLLQQAILSRSGLPVLSNDARMLSSARSPQDLKKAIVELKKMIEYLQGNVSPAAVCGHLMFALR